METTNLRALDSLGGALKTFTALDSDPQMVKLVDNMCPVGRSIKLKIGAQVSYQRDYFVCMVTFL